MPIYTNGTITGTITGFRPRPQEKINETRTHEYIHANKKQSLKEKWYGHSELNGEWDTLIECELAKGSESQVHPNIQENTIEGKNQIEYNIEHYQQCIHSDHAGEAMQTTDGNGNQIDLINPVTLQPVLYPLTSGMQGFEQCEGYDLPHE